MIALVGCEESQAVCIAFRAKGHEAYSNDLQECSGGHPEWHIIADVREVIKGGWFTTQAGTKVFINKWDIIILHCPCTYTGVCGNKHYHNSPLRIEAAMFCKEVYELACKECERVVLEQPKTIMQKYIGKRSQIIQPYMFGHPEQKQTWLWVKGLPLLKETNNVYEDMIKLPIAKQQRIFWMGKNKGKERSKTYPGIATAIANQWG